MDARDLDIKNLVSKFITGDFKLLKFKKTILKYTKIQDMISITKLNP
ncbi:MAG: hypothetical protein LBV42_03340 [Methanobrevibacter sp.]|nr:hypothetical protein [Methanobrevibacter sp.]